MTPHNNYLEEKIKNFENLNFPFRYLKVYNNLNKIRR